MRQGFQRGIDLRGIGTAALGEIGLAAATAAKHLGSAANQVAGLHPRLAGCFIGGHGNHRLVVLIHAGEGDNHRFVVTQPSANVHDGLAQHIERSEVADVLRDHHHRGGRIGGCLNEFRHRRRQLSLVHRGKAAIGVFELG